MINKAILVGRVGHKEFKLTRTGTPMCQLSIATEEKYLDSMGNQKKVTTWHNVNVYDKKAEATNKYAFVGDVIYIEGKINNNKIEQDGKSSFMYSVTAEKVKFLPNPRKENPTNESETHSHDYTPHNMEQEDVDVPF